MDKFLSAMKVGQLMLVGNEFFMGIDVLIGWFRLSSTFAKRVNAALKRLKVIQ